MDKRPTVSVIMPVYNAERFVREAIESILAQTYADFEFIIINDGSTDRSDEIIKSFSDPRIRLITQKNQGITTSLNTGLQNAQGTYIARMDADDVALPDRVAKQVAFLDADPDIALCGTWAHVIDEDGKKIGAYTYPPVSAKAILWYAFLHNPFIHPSIMLRRTVVEQIGPYDTRTPFGQDYEYWTRIIARYKTANIPEFLLNYRITKSGATQQKKVRPYAKFRIRARFIKNIAIALTKKIH